MSQTCRVALLGSLLWLPGILFSQGSGGISGTVTDTAGALVGGAKVTVLKVDTGAVRAANSDSSGFFSVTPLSPGTYTITVESQGFQRYEQTGVNLGVDERLRIDATLQLGQQSQTVTVAGQAVAVNTADATIRSVVDVKRMVDLPLNGRSPLQLMLLAPGVLPSPAIGMGTSFQPSGQQFVASSGSKANGMNYILDGGDNMDTYRDVANSFPNPDILQEFSVQTNNYSAEFGGRGGGVVNAVTKSGTNELHGTAFEFLRNYDLNARNVFASTNDGLKRNQYGGTIGGPVWIPHLYNGRNRTFFFFGIQQTSVRQVPTDASARVFTQDERNGNFSDLKNGLGNLIVIRDPDTGLPFPGNQIPTARLDPVFQNLLKLIPVAPDPSGIVRYAVPARNDETQYSVRIDHEFTQNDRFFARVFKDNYLQPNEGVTGNLLSYTNSRSQRGTNATMDYTKIFSPRVLADWSFTFNRSAGLRGAVSPTTWTDLGANIPPAGTSNDFLLFIPNYFNEVLYGNTPLIRNNFEYKASLGWMVGSHNLRFGVSAIKRQFNIPTVNISYHGQFSFDRALTGDNGADAILGRPGSFEQDTGFQVALRETDWVGWVTDDYKISRRLTLNLGLRYEPFLPWVDKWNSLPQIAQFVPGVQSTVYPNAPLGLLFYGDAGVTNRLARGSLDRFAPRVGFAYDVTGDGKTSLRGGYGVFYSVLLPSEQYQSYSSNIPNFSAIASFNLPPSTADPYAGRPVPFPAQLPRDRNFQFPMPINEVTDFYSSDFTNPYIQQWNMTLERQVFNPSIVVRASYQGSKGTRLPVSIEADPAIYSPGNSTTANTDQRRPYAPNYASIVMGRPVGNSTYNGLVLSLEKRFSRSYSVLASYTWSKNIDDGEIADSPDSTQISNPFRYNSDRGLASSDRTHAFVLSYLWDLPKLQNAPAILRYVAGGWQNNGIISVYSGLPFTVFSGVDNSLSGVGQDHADQVGTPALGAGRSTQEYFNTQAFALNALGTFGNTGRDSLRGPGFANVDWSLFKQIPIVERQYLQFRAEFFNLFNHPNFNNPVATVTNPLFGQIISAGSPRIIQFALKYVF